MASNMEAIASTQDLKPWVQQLVANDEWLDRFDEDTGRINKVVIVTATTPFNTKVDAIGIIPKEALKPYGLHESFIGRPVPAHKLTANDAMLLMVRSVIMPHEQTALHTPGRDPNMREVDYCDFVAAQWGVTDFVHRTLVHQRHTAKFGEQIVNFLAKGVKPIIVMS